MNLKRMIERTISSTRNQKLMSSDQEEGFSPFDSFPYPQE